MLITIIHGRMFRSKRAHVWKVTDKIGGVQKKIKPSVADQAKFEFFHFMSTFVKENKDEFLAFQKETDRLDEIFGDT